MARQYGRQYAIKMDEEVRRFHVTLGKDSIGFHSTREGAEAVAVSHALRMRLPFAAPAWTVTHED